MFSVVLVFSIIGLGRILISDLVVANLLMYSLTDMILLYLATPFFTPKVFLDEIYHTRRLLIFGGMRILVGNKSGKESTQGLHRDHHKSVSQDNPTQDVCSILLFFHS